MAEAPSTDDTKQADSDKQTKDEEYSEKIMKVPPVHSSDEIYRYVDLGLGRGIDGTDPTPWLNKTSFQVRRVTYDNILGTEEGGAVQSYEREISSVQTQQTKIKTSILVPKSPLTIGTDAELSRSIHASRRAIGRKVINRTISFRDNFDDIPFGDSVLPVDETEASDGTIQNLWTFEQRLAHWIMDKLKNSWEEEVDGKAVDRLMLPSSDADTNKCPLKDLIFVIKENRREDQHLIKEACMEFVTHFRITHYVSAIELGAAEYRVFTEDEYQNAVSIAGSFGIDKLASAVTQQNYTYKRKRKASDLKKIGIISKDDRVVRGSYGEAVVNVSINPIAALVKTKYLRDQMEKALFHFVESQSDRSDGPFLISCGSGLFLQVVPSYAVVGTPVMRDASEFHIIPNDRAGKTNEFLIGYYKPVSESEAGQSHGRRQSVFSESNKSKVIMYLNAPLNLLGKNSGPLFVQDTVSDSTSRFVLHSRIVSQKKHQLPVPLSEWTSGGDMFYINCSRRDYRRDGYVSLRQRPVRRHNETREYRTACTSSTKHHDGNNFFMLFQLLSIPLRVEEDEQTSGVDPIPQATIAATTFSSEGLEMAEIK